MKRKDYFKSELFRNIYSYIKDKDVLDIGCVGHTIMGGVDNPNVLWIHHFLNRYANVLGIDILREEVQQLNDRGYNVKHANAESFNISKKFDVIFAGELIEHLGNPGLFLERARKHLKKKGFLILTTPNTFSLKRLVTVILTLETNLEVNPDHTSWFSPTTIKELLKRSDFKIEKLDYFNLFVKKPLFIGKIRRIIEKLFGTKFKESMLIIARKVK